jgi:hypothetical protein
VLAMKVCLSLTCLSCPIRFQPAYQRVLGSFWKIRSPGRVARSARAVRRGVSLQGHWPQQLLHKEKLCKHGGRDWARSLFEPSAFSFMSAEWSFNDEASQNAFD